MMKSSVPPNAPVALPPLVAAYVEATNSFDLERLIVTFAEKALGKAGHQKVGDTGPHLVRD